MHGSSHAAVAHCMLVSRLTTHDWAPPGPDVTNHKDATMPKGQQSNREKRKPKADKPKVAPQASPFAAAPGMGKGKPAAGTKKR
jgi:hypothetical protein